MPDTLFADVSEFQPYVDFTKYPYDFISIRANDGTYRDKKFAVNYARAKAAADSGRITGFVVYFVWHPNWQAGIDTLKSMVGTPHRKMAVMMDVESWEGKITGDQSKGINAARAELVAWLEDKRRVIGYANAGDFAALWPTRSDIKVILANYSSNPPFPFKIAHQFSSTFNVPPFGKCDINSADGLSATELAEALGLAPAVVITKPTKPIQLPEGGTMLAGYIHAYPNTDKPYKGVYLVAVDLMSKVHITDPQSHAFLRSTKLYADSDLSDAMVDSIPLAKG